ncbi:hypothetical protein [Endozoicomonas ascidiicola]|uniref:hypothetical protein n=1 Tax=Endozoicomonas ascidiicola TaxID=1698521 RepID=UPI000833BAED|nr:hypothetical protein [Endozoicomonas ascidiicola]
MSEPKHTTMDAIHDAILRAVTDHWKDQPNQLDTVAEYDPFEKNPVNSPGVLFSIENMALDASDQTGRTGIILDCNLTCVLSIKTDRVQVQIRQFAAELVRLVEQKGLSHWGLGNACTKPGNVNSQPALYSPEKSGFESWAVTWSQTFYIGGPTVEPMPLPERIYASKAPDIGTPAKPDYQQLTGFPDESI